MCCLCLMSSIKPTERNKREFRWIRFVLIYVIEKFPFLVTELLSDLINNCITQSDRLHRTQRKLRMTDNLCFLSHIMKENGKNINFILFSLIVYKYFTIPMRL
jgi:hypothetical protein